MLFKCFNWVLKVFLNLYLCAANSLTRPWPTMVRELCDNSRTKALNWCCQIAIKSKREKGKEQKIDRERLCACAFQVHCRSQINIGDRCRRRWRWRHSATERDTDTATSLAAVTDSAATPSKWGEGDGNDRDGAEKSHNPIMNFHINFYSTRAPNSNPNEPEPESEREFEIWK